MSIICDFCGKNEHNVALLIAPQKTTNEHIHICNECVHTCVKIIADLEREIAVISACAEKAEMSAEKWWDDTLALEKAKAEIEALRARAEKAEAELAKHQWQPIETAPKIELAEVVLWNGKAVCAGSWWEGSWSTLHDYIDPQPTHWMPLPEPPKEKEKCAS